jgi:peptide/nickel transport system substrate-binding protein
MRPSRLVIAGMGLVLAAAVLASGVTPTRAQAPRHGGVLNLMLREDLAQGFSIHETATIATVWPGMPCFSNLVLFDPLKKTESMDTVIGELAEKWSWQDNSRNLVFLLRKNVKWHDGQPFTSKDVKYTFDMIREVPEATAKLRINPRKDWYANVEAIEAPDPYTVVFRLKRPQPSLLMLLASGYSPVYPAHLSPSSYRTGCVGTGPFKLKVWKRGEYIDFVRNPDYFIKDRPYLDGLHYVIIQERGTRFAALQAGQLDVAFPGEGTKTLGEQTKKAQPRLKLTITGTNVNDNLIMNITKPPFNDVRVRRALSYAISRERYVQVVAQGGALLGASMLPRPFGVWGLLDKDLKQLSGYGTDESDKAKARTLLAAAGYGPAHPLTVEMDTRAIALYVDFAAFIVSELKKVNVNVNLKEIETAQWHPMVTRGEYSMGANLTGIGPDDPDANFYENYACGSPRNYTRYCSEQVMKMIDAQSQELDAKKRLAMVWDIQKKLEEDAARPIMGWRSDYFLQWDYVRNLIPHQSIYNYGRMQEVWLDKK